MSAQGTLIYVSDVDLTWLRDLASDTLPGAADRLAALLASEGPHIYPLEGALPGVHHLLVGDDSGLLAFLMDATVGEPIALPLPHTAAHVLLPPTVAAIADAIESMSVRPLRLRLAGDALRAVEPFAGRPLEDEDKEWLLAVLQGLMTFMRRAAKDRVSLLVARHPGADDPS